MKPNPSRPEGKLTALEARAIALDQLCDGFSHDARNPMNAVVIHLEVLSDKLRREQGEIPATLEKNLRAIRDQVGRLEELIRRFVDLAAPHRQTGPDFDLGSLVGSVLELCAHQTRCVQSEIRAECQPGLRLAGPSSELGVAICLLVIESLRAGRGQRLLLRAEREGAHARLILDGASLPGPSAALAEAERVAAALGGSVEWGPSRLVLRLPLARAEATLRVIADEAPGAAERGAEEHRGAGGSP